MPRRSSPDAMGRIFRQIAVSQLGPRGVVRGVFARLVREPVYFWISVAFGIAFGVMNTLNSWRTGSADNIRSAVFAFAVSIVFSFSIGYLTVPAWRLGILPRRWRTTGRVIAANGLFTMVLGVTIFSGAFFLIGWAVFGFEWARRATTVLPRIGAMGLIFGITSFPMILSWMGDLWHRRESARAARLERLAEEARIVALRSQINPHFFFNALNTIAALIPARPWEAERAVELLATALRPALMREQPLLAILGQELEIARAYADIEQLRHGDRLSIAFHADDDALGATVPSLFLQPLIENAVTHGASHTTRAFAIVVRARVAEGLLHVEVASGPADEDPLLASDSGTRAPLNPGHALHNIDARLRALFGARAGLQVHATPAGAAIARVVLPVDGPKRDALALIDRTRAERAETPAGATAHG